MIIPASIWSAGMVSPHVWTDTERASGLMPDALGGDFTLVGWYNAFGTSVLPVRLWNMGIGLKVDVVDNGGTHQLKVHDGANGIAVAITDDLSTDGTGWTCLIVRRDGTTLSTFEGKTKLSDTTISVVDYGSAVRAVSKAIELADLRVVSVALSDAAIEYYYDDVIENEGNETHPRW